MTFEIEYLGEFGFVFENILDYDTVSQMGSFEGKTEVENLVQVPLSRLARTRCIQ